MKWIIHMFNYNSKNYVTSTANVSKNTFIFIKNKTIFLWNIETHTQNA